MIDCSKNDTILSREAINEKIYKNIKEII